MNYWIVMLCSIAFLCLSKGFITIFFGSKYVIDTITVIAIVLNFYTSNIRQTLWMFRETTGIFEDTKSVTGVTAIVNIFLSILMGYIWGIRGIVFATVISRIVYAWWKEPQVIFQKHFKISPSFYYRLYVKRLLLFTSLAFIIYCFCEWLPINNIYLEFILQILICGIIPNAVFLQYIKTPKSFNTF